MPLVLFGFQNKTSSSNKNISLKSDTIHFWNRELFDRCTFGLFKINRIYSFILKITVCFKTTARIYHLPVIYLLIHSTSQIPTSAINGSLSICKDHRLFRCRSETVLRASVETFPRSLCHRFHHVGRPGPRRHWKYHVASSLPRRRTIYPSPLCCAPVISCGFMEQGEDGSSRLIGTKLACFKKNEAIII